MKTDKKPTINPWTLPDDQNLENNQQMNGNPRNYIKSSQIKIPELDECLENDKPDVELESAQILSIEILQSGSDTAGKIWTITPYGCKQSKRKSNDGYTYFGYEELQTDSNMDYIIQPKDGIVDQRYYGVHFQIRFNKTDARYYIKDMGHGLGTFIKWNDWLQLKNKSLINIGENYIVFTWGFDSEMQIMEKFSGHTSESYQDIINVKIFSGDIKHGMVQFTPDKEMFTIGRNHDCDIPINDNLLSRVHCTVKYKDGYWYLRDGSVLEDNKYKKSTNSSWEFAYEEVEIYEKMTIKASHNLFICSYNTPTKE